MLLAIPLTSTLVVGTAFASPNPSLSKTDTVKYSSTTASTSTSSASKNGNDKLDSQTNNAINTKGTGAVTKQTVCSQAYTQAVTKANADYKASKLQAKSALTAALKVAKNNQDKLQANQTYKSSIKSASLTQTSALKQTKADKSKCPVNVKATNRNPTQ